MTLDSGVLLYGVDEDSNQIASAILPIALAASSLQIQQVIDAAIFPRPETIITELPVNPGDPNGVVCVVVPASTMVPHMAGDRYPARSGTRTRYLSEREVERLYGQRRAVVERGATRQPLAEFVTPEGGFTGSSGRGGIGILRVFVSPVGDATHPAGVHVGAALEAVTRDAIPVVSALTTPQLDPRVIDNLDRWHTRGTMGWAAGFASDDERQLRNVVLASANYSHFSNGLSFYVTVDLGAMGERHANEHIFALETMASLAVAGRFYEDFEGVSLVFVDLSLSGLDNSISSKPGRSTLRRISDSFYVESGVFPTSDLANNPAEAARTLLDRFLIGFLDRGEDVFDDLQAGRYTP